MITGSPAVVTPQGAGVKQVEWRDMLLLEHFAATWGRVDGAQLGIHCGKCGQDVVANNKSTDKVLSVSCLCSEYFASRPEAH